MNKIYMMDKDMKTARAFIYDSGLGSVSIDETTDGVNWNRTTSKNTISFLMETHIKNGWKIIDPKEIKTLNARPIDNYRQAIELITAKLFPMSLLGGTENKAKSCYVEICGDVIPVEEMWDSRYYNVSWRVWDHIPSKEQCENASWKAQIPVKNNSSITDAYTEFKRLMAEKEAEREKSK